MDVDRGFYECLHPDTAEWFRGTFAVPSEGQRRCLPDIAAGRSVLLSSPTGSGKTLAGFLGILDVLVREHREGRLAPAGIRCVYLSPLRALGYDIRKNLEEPIRGLGLGEVVRVGLRSGDTPPAERQRQRRRPPHFLVTTPESLAILLPQAGWREAFARCDYLVVDELHAFVENKRGVHLCLSAERLERHRRLLPGRAPLCRIGLSATVAPLERVARFLGGSGPPPVIHEVRSGRRLRLEVLTPLRKHAYPPAGYTASRMISDMAAVVERNRTTLLFTNTRSGAERVAHRLKLALPLLAESIECHHSSLDRDLRQDVEDRLKNGELRAVVCSTSLELGIDIGHIDTVIMVSTPKGITRVLQRVGRSGHSLHQTSHGVLVATNINDLIECVVCSRLAKERRLDPVKVLEFAPDVVIQHFLGLAMEGGISRDEAFELVRSAEPFRNFQRETLDRIVEYLEGGGRALSAAYRETFGKIVERDGLYFPASRQVERDYLANIGTIHADGMVAVRAGRRRLGAVEEAFAKGLKGGDIFVLAGRTLRLLESSPLGLVVEEAKGRMPTVPSWNANKMPLASGLARAVAALRTEVDRRLDEGAGDPAEVADWLVEQWSISRTNAAAILDHFANQRLLSRVPTEGRFLIERYLAEEEEETERIHFFFHSLIGRSANDALSRIVTRRLKEVAGGNALATVDDYGFLLSVRGFQDLDLAGWRALFCSEGAAETLDEALRGSHLVKWQFSGVAQTGLMIPRNRAGGERPVRQLRWSAGILHEVLSQHEPDHLLLEQALHEAKHTFLDLDRALAFLDEAGEMSWELVEVPAVSPFAFGLYASKIRESLMMESPEEAIERLYREMRRKLGRSDD